jgi:quinol monooxygenase YgiN
VRPLRVLHQFTADPGVDDALVEHLRAVRAHDGCRQADAYRGLEDPLRVAVVETWESVFDHGEHWQSRFPGEGGPTPVHGVETRTAEPSEFYLLEPFMPAGGWAPVAHAGRTARVQFPAGNGVRVIGTMTVTNIDEWRTTALEQAAESRREPGCLQFESFLGIEDPRMLLDLELFGPPQQVYDAHWSLRLRTGASQWGVQRAMAGPPSIEFYRHEQFVHLYDRWVPLDVARWSEQVVWPH